MAARTFGNWRHTDVEQCSNRRDRTYADWLEFSRVSPTRESLIGSFNDLECLVDFNLLGLKWGRVRAMVEGKMYADTRTIRIRSTSVSSEFGMPFQAAIWAFNAVAARTMSCSERA